MNSFVLVLRYNNNKLFTYGTQDFAEEKKIKNFFIKLQHRRKACVLYSNNSSLHDGRRDLQKEKKIKKIFIKLQHRRKACVLYIELKI